MARVNALGCLIRETPVVRLEHDELELYAKLEHANPVGSIKDRPAYWILKSAIERGEVHARSSVVESSSGNFAIALAVLCRLLGIRFLPVIDPNITATYEETLRRHCNLVVKVEERDDTGGYLKTRLRKVTELCSSLNAAYWTNQYGNRDGMQAHYQLTGAELCSAFDRLDYVFIGVSTGGTISGVSRRVKEHFPNAKVIAVDAEGSVIFGGKPKKRYIPGIGASIVPELLQHALIDDVVTVPEIETVEACHELLNAHGLFVGGSSGSAYAAVKKYLPRMRTADGRKPRALFISPDRGTAYLDTLYNPEWVMMLRKAHAPQPLPLERAG